LTLRVSLEDTRRAIDAQNATQSWRERAACLVHVENEQGTRGHGEASPLPGFSPDTLSECQRALGAFDPAGTPPSLAGGQSALFELGRASARLPSTLPAARAALEGALLDLWARAAGRPAWALLQEPFNVPATRTVAALLMGTPDQALAQAERARARGVRAFKLKIGRPGALAAELTLVAELRSALGGASSLRLDANQSLTAEQARHWLPQFARHDLEYVEEPCPPNERSQLPDLGIPWALDESLSALRAGSAAARSACGPAVRVLILKPSLLGGVCACADWARFADEQGLDVVVSHAFEGALGLALAAAVALSFGAVQRAHGLDVVGAQLDAAQLPFLSGPQIQPWDEPGFGIAEVPP